VPKGERGGTRRLLPERPQADSPKKGQGGPQAAPLSERVILAVIGERLPSLSLSEKELSINRCRSEGSGRNSALAEFSGAANCILGAAFLGFRVGVQALDFLEIELISGHMGNT
jgi:hypothetical protein